VVIGCAVERDPRRFLSLPGVAASLGTREKFELPRLVRSGLPVGGTVVRRGGVGRLGARLDRRGIRGFGGRRRACLKIQDGCDYRCAYCIIPSLRGRSVSRPPDEIVAEARGLIEAGYREIVLTGIHIGLYGRDLEPRRTLASLLRTLLAGTSGARIRLSSIDAFEIGEDLIGTMAGSDRVCRHLHIPIQSGSPRILRAMGRRGTVEQFLEVCERARRAMPSLGLGTDVIVGFPGETEDDFERTRELVESVPFAYGHVFPFSARPGTRAHRLVGGRVPAAAVRARAEEIRRIAERSGRAFRAGLAGSREEVLVERGRGGLYEGRCSNYVKAFVRGDGLVEGERLPVRIGGVLEDGVDAVGLAHGEARRRTGTTG
jgi:threonylcarbamoyladenosine tRNA methylthiotransferase MtaB